MLTQCPRCETIYRLGAADLGAAQGFVECGECAKQFNALQRLGDEPNFSATPTIDSLPRTTISEPSVAKAVDASTGPLFVLIDAEEIEARDEIEVIDEPVAQTNCAYGVEQQDAEGEEDPAETPLSDVTAPTQIVDDQNTLPTAATTAPGVDLGSAETLEIPIEDLEEVPDILKQDVAALSRPRSSMRSVWIFLTLVFFLGLLVQALWLFRIRIVSAAPALQPVLQKVCTYFPCTIALDTAPNTIELIARDVRDHPQYRNTLLVNATLVSRSPLPSKFPIIQLGFYGQVGEAIGIRRFEPSEYLDRSMDFAAGMPSNGRIYIVFEIVGIGTNVTSFEFTFL